VTAPSSSDVKKHLGKVIRQLRQRQHISQEELAARAGLHRTYVSDIERGARNVSIESLEKLVVALRVSLAQLFRSFSK
jgi:transcriptional regulator with XRE-family HTH domain